MPCGCSAKHCEIKIDNRHFRRMKPLMFIAGFNLYHGLYGRNIHTELICGLLKVGFCESVHYRLADYFVNQLVGKSINAVQWYSLTT
jgi:hypothetical protein